MGQKKISITDLFTEEELERLARAFVKSCKADEVFHESEVGKVWNWAADIVIQKGLLDIILEGKLAVRIGEGGEPMFRKIEEREGGKKGED